jgi:hypothetical protein
MRFSLFRTCTAVTNGAEYEVRNTMIQVPCWWRATPDRRANMNTRMITTATVSVELYRLMNHEVPR